MELIAAGVISVEQEGDISACTLLPWLSVSDIFLLKLRTEADYCIAPSAFLCCSLFSHS